ncbi:MAG: hypothetical protein CL946_02115 [Ectothiorhodospiraceae bacterium]|nr:hypothetical protein [Ectothiorhodospiraceae bacterium]
MEGPHHSIAVFLPNYNYEAYLADRIESILHQSRLPDSFLIIDDGSQDRSRSIIRQYETHDLVRTQYRMINSGSPYAMRNEVVRNETADFILFAEADDSAEPQLLERLYDVMKQDEEIAIAYAQSHSIDSQGKVIGTWADWLRDLGTDKWDSDFIATGREMAPYLAFKNIIPNSSAALLRRDAFLECGGYDLRNRLSADWLLYAQMIRSRKIAYIAEPLNRFRTHGGTVRSASVRNGTAVLEYMRILRYLFGAYTFTPEQTEQIKRFAIGKWMGLISRYPTGASATVHFEIYRHAKVLFDDLFSDIIRRLPRSLLRAINQTSF